MLLERVRRIESDAQNVVAVLEKIIDNQSRRHVDPDQAGPVDSAASGES